MILLGCPGVMPEWPLDQSYDTAYAKIFPLRLKAVAEIGPGDGSKAVWCDRVRYWNELLSITTLPFSRVRASLSQKLTVPSEPFGR